MDNIPKETCPKCNGEGAILHNDLQLADYVCEWCGGCGKVDWIEKMRGKKKITMVELYNFCKKLWIETELVKYEFPFEGVVSFSGDPIITIKGKGVTFDNENEKK
jgi:hypothetical protein